MPGLAVWAPTWPGGRLGWRWVIAATRTVVGGPMAFDAGAVYGSLFSSGSEFFPLSVLVLHVTAHARGGRVVCGPCRISRMVAMSWLICFLGITGQTALAWFEQVATTLLGVPW